MTAIDTSSFEANASLLTPEILKQFDATAPFLSAEEYYAPLVEANPQLHEWLYSNQEEQEWNTDTKLTLFQGPDMRGRADRMHAKNDTD